MASFFEKASALVREAIIHWSKLYPFAAHASATIHRRRILSCRRLSPPVGLRSVFRTSAYVKR